MPRLVRWRLIRQRVAMTAREAIFVEP